MLQQFNREGLTNHTQNEVKKYKIQIYKIRTCRPSTKSHSMKRQTEYHMDFALNFTYLILETKTSLKKVLDLNLFYFQDPTSIQKNISKLDKANYSD